ncbi:MAG: hypothetical protein RIM68_08490 [Arenibacter sp.]
MDITFTLTDIDGADIPQEKIDLLCASLGIDDQDDLQDRINNVALASLVEYIEMLVGKGMSNRADEAKQDRLFYLIKQVFTPRVPGDDAVSVMFQLTSTQSKSLLRNTLSRYRTRLKDEIATTLVEIYKAATLYGDSGNYEVPIESEVFVELLNQIVAREGADYFPITKKRESGNSKYRITADTHRMLGEYFGE